MGTLINAATPIWRLIIVLVSLLGAVLLIGGVAIAYFGSTAQTTFTIFGSQFSSTSVGLSLAFIGVVLVGVVLRRTLASVDRLGTSPKEGIRKD